MPESDTSKIPVQWSSISLAAIGGLGLFGMLKESFFSPVSFLDQMKKNRIHIEYSPDCCLVSFESIGLDRLMLENFNDFQHIYYGPIRLELHHIVNILRTTTSLIEREQVCQSFEMILFNLADMLPLFRSKIYKDRNGNSIYRTSRELQVVSEISDDLYAIAIEFNQFKADVYHKLIFPRKQGVCSIQ